MSVNSDRVCILGTPSSGKSTYLLALYYLLTKDDNFTRQYTVKFPRGGDSEIYYQDELCKLMDTGFPAKTVVGQLFDADMLVTHHTRKDILRVSTKDASGEQLEKLFRTEYSKLRKYLKGEEVEFQMGDQLILDLMKSSSNFILFWDPDIRADGHNQTQFLKNIIRTLEEIHREDWSGLAIALLITKADAFPHVRRCYPYLFKHSGDLITKLKAYLNTRFAIFPVSSLGGFRWEPGGHDKSWMASRRELAPKNVIEPLLWFQRVAEEKQVFVRQKRTGGGLGTYLTPIEHNPWYDTGFDDILGGL